jgi:hypothetical protein
VHGLFKDLLSATLAATLNNGASLELIGQERSIDVIGGRRPRTIAKGNINPNIEIFLAIVSWFIVCFLGFFPRARRQELWTCVYALWMSGK